MLDIIVLLSMFVLTLLIGFITNNVKNDKE